MSLKLDKNEDLETVKAKYLVTANDKKCKRVDTKLLTGSTLPEAVTLID